MQINQLITDERRLDMLIGAIEGGSNYWYNFQKQACTAVDRAQPSDGALSFVERLFIAIKSGRSIAVHDIENGDSLGEISLQSIEKGEATMLQNQPEHFADILSESDDAITADVWFQYCVMNEIIYG